MANFIINSDSIYSTNGIIKELDNLIREEVFPRNAWDTPKQTIDEKGQITVDWKIEGVAGLKIIRFTVDNERVARLSFYNGSKFSYFVYDSDYTGYAWIIRQQMAVFHNFYTAFLKRVDETK